MDIETLLQNQNSSSLNPLQSNTVDAKKNDTSLAEASNKEEVRKSISQSILNPVDKVSIQGKTLDTAGITPSYNNLPMQKALIQRDEDAIANVVSSPITSTLSGGSTVTIFSQKYDREDGSTGTQLMAQIQGVNGEKQEFAITEDTLISEDKENNLIIQKASDHSLNGTDNNDVIISMGSGTINTGKGDNTVLLVGAFSSAKVNGGSGNDTVIAGDLFQAKINLGEGNNSLQAKSTSFGTTITANDGNNSISIEENIGLGDSGKLGTSITLGNGDNTLRADNLSNVTLGNGNNTVTANNLDNVTIGDGNNTISAQKVLGVGIGQRNLTVGNGNNTITLDEVSGGYAGSLVAGDGNNNITINNIGSKIIEIQIDGLANIRGSSNNAVTLGDGNNTLTVTGSVEGASVTFGDGDNSFTVNGSVKGSSFQFGNGNNNAAAQGAVKDSLVGFGSGHNQLQMLGLLDNIAINGAKSGSVDLSINSDTANDVYVNEQKAA